MPPACRRLIYVPPFNLTDKRLRNRHAGPELWARVLRTVQALGIEIEVLPD